MIKLGEPFHPEREFWACFELDKTCPHCGWMSNGYTSITALLARPVDVTCKKCGYEWGICLDVPQNNTNNMNPRGKIIDLIKTEERFHALQDELKLIVKKLSTPP